MTKHVLTPIYSDNYHGKEEGLYLGQCSESGAEMRLAGPRQSLMSILVGPGYPVETLMLFHAL